MIEEGPACDDAARLREFHAEPATDAPSATSGRFCRQFEPEGLQGADVSPGQRCRQRITRAENRTEVRNPWQNQGPFSAKPPRSRMARARGTDGKRRHQAQTVSASDKPGRGRRAQGADVEHDRRAQTAGSSAGVNVGIVRWAARLRRVRSQASAPPAARPGNPNAAPDLLPNANARVMMRAQATSAGMGTSSSSKPGPRTRKAGVGPGPARRPETFLISPLAHYFEACYCLKHPRVARPVSWQIGLAPLGVADVAAVHRIFPHNLISDALRVVAHTSLLPFAPSLLRPRLPRLTLGRSSP